jgi:hypothetical protein
MWICGEEITTFSKNSDSYESSSYGLPAAKNPKTAPPVLFLIFYF